MIIKYLGFLFTLLWSYTFIKTQNLFKKGSGLLINLFVSKTGQDLNWSYGPRRSGDVTEIYANVSKAKETLSWEAKYSIGDALVHAWQWEKNINKKMKHVN